MSPAPFWRPVVLTGLAACLVLSACEKTEVPRAVKRTHPRGSDTTAGQDRVEQAGKQPFVYARARRSEAPVPARFKADLPTSLAQFLGDWSHYPPRPLIEGGLCAGDADMQSRYMAAVRKAAAEGPVDKKLTGAFSGLLGYCSSEKKCAWLAKSVEAEKDGKVRKVIFAGLTRCTQDRYSALFERDDAPGDAILEWLFSLYGKTPTRWNKQLGRAAREVIAEGKRYQIRKVGVALGRFKGPEPVRLVEKLQKEIADPEHRALVALGLGDHPSKQAKALFKSACAHSKVGEDPMCRPAQALPADAAREKPARQGVDAEVRSYDYDVAAQVKAKPKLRTRIVAALENCLQDPKAKEYTLRTCLARLAVLDRKRAATEAAKVDPKRWKSDWSRGMVNALIRFPESGALEGKLSELGLLPPDKVRSKAGEDSLTARGVLENAGLASSFDTETGQFPNEHDGLLKELAGLAGKDMDGAVFEEVVPRDDRGPYLLRGYLHGKRWEVTAENLGDWYDMGAVLGLLNAMLRDRNSPVRFVSLPTGDQTATVLAGPRQGLQAAAKDGLIRFAGAHDAMDSGKAFEEKVFQQLKAEGKDVIRNVGVGDGIVTE